MSTEQMGTYEKIYFALWPWYWKVVHYIFPAAPGTLAFVKLNSMGASMADIRPEYIWGPRYEKWEHVTVGDMLNKFEGNDPAHFACGVDAFENFDLVASGARDIGRHAGPPWYDGLVYETIRGISDLLAQRPDPALKARVDGYIARIEAAQKSDPDGFVGTNTQLTEDNHRWGANGGSRAWR